MRGLFFPLKISFRWCLAVIVGCLYMHPAFANYLVREHLVTDLRSGVEWMRCSVGQTYELDTGECAGEIVKLTHEETEQAIKIANEELGGRWRLPTKDELRLLVCTDCPPPMIDKIVFPRTAAEPYWTGQQNWISPKNFWSVNFMTGHSYARFFPTQKLAVRLVRDRR